MAESDKTQNTSPPAVPAKEPIDNYVREVVSESTTKGGARLEPAPTTENKTEMAGDAGHNKAPSDDSRSKPSYSDAVTGFENEGSLPAPPPRIKSKGKGGDFDGSIDKDGDRDMMDLSSMEMFDVVSYQTSHSKTGLPTTAEEDEPDDEELPAGYEKTSFSRRKDPESKMQEENVRLRRLIQELSKKANHHITEKQIAEEKAERATERLGEMKHAMNSGMTEIERDTETLAHELKIAKDENQALREQLKDAQSHIFSLQPYRKDLTPEEIGREYDNIVESVQDWVQKFMEPWLEDHTEGVEAILSNARKRTSEANKFKRVLHQYPDLVHAAQFPETDEDIIASIILRYLHDNIFQVIMYGDIPRYTEVVSFIENSMQMSVEPKRDLFSVRTWTAEAYNALLSSPSFRSVRERRRKDMTIELCSLLRIFCKKEKMTWFYENMDDNCVWPAMKLYEKLQVSTHHFYLDINSYIMWGSGGDLNMSPEFIEGIKNLDCRNILQNRKGFNVNKIDPAPTKKELYHRLVNVCTVVPALYMRQIGQRDSIKEPTIVRKQHMLVAWGPEEKRRTFTEKGDRTIVSHLYHSKNDRSGDGWIAFRWG